MQRLGFKQQLDGQLEWQLGQVLVLKLGQQHGQLAEARPILVQAKLAVRPQLLAIEQLVHELWGWVLKTIARLQTHNHVLSQQAHIVL